MTDYNDGLWHFSEGYPCPANPTGLHRDSIVAIRAANSSGRLVEDDNRCVWAHDWSIPTLFKVVTQYAEPKTIWVNEYTNDFMMGHPTRELAVERAMGDAIRTAVEYREVR